MEGDAKAVGNLTGRDQQFGHFGRFRAEFGGKAQLRMVGRDADAHAQFKVGRRHAIGGGGADDLFQFLVAVEAEGAHAMVVIGLRDRTFRLHRVHEAQLRIGQEFVHEAHFAQRGDVIMRDPRRPQRFKQRGRGIGLYGVERPARKLLDKEAGGARRSMRTKECYGLIRRKSAD